MVKILLQTVSTLLAYDVKNIIMYLRQLNVKMIFASPSTSDLYFIWWRWIGEPR